MFKIWSSLFLSVCAVIDIKTNKVVQSFCIINYILSLIVKAFLNELDIFVLIVGVIICGILFSISVITKEAIGKGDVLILLALTGILSVKYIIEIFVIGLWSCSIFSIAMLLIKKMKRKDSIPFVPFLLIGHCLWLISGGQYV